MTGCLTSKRWRKRKKAVGKAAIGNLLGGIGYFYGQSKIAISKGLSLKNGENSISYWPAELYTAVPSRSFFPRGFLLDEGFHQLLIWRWDVDICMNIIGQWLDLLNIDGWIPREQILGAEALSKVPEEAVAQDPSNGNPPTLLLALRVTTYLEQYILRNSPRKRWRESQHSSKGLMLAWMHGFNGSIPHSLGSMKEPSIGMEETTLQGRN